MKVSFTTIDEPTIQIGVSLPLSLFHELEEWGDRYKVSRSLLVRLMVLYAWRNGTISAEPQGKHTTIAWIDRK